MIWLIGGTSESVTIAHLLTKQRQDFIVTVTTPNATKLYQSISHYQILVGKLSSSEIASFIRQYKIDLIIDSSHPFAVNISQTVINISEQLQICYIRYERPLINNSSSVIYINSIESLLTENSLIYQKRVLLTIGAKFLHLFTNYHQSATLYARILPYSESINQAYQANFSCDRIIALRPPISAQLEKALWQMWNIDIVITKAGGKAGGEDIKQEIAQELNIPLIIIQRPKLNYPLMISSIEEISFYLKRLF
ncbi:cobalt-precorrin-6A reductase [Geminocystis sp. NIES-3709]|uniref:cobalt-precorrin-6A reductase n=1 Tax=Geminocystis sp. NIES-3709 TaxID=1617448 RepID=UPI0005FC956C|nr:cobalt-precorrin-6A reductase [Geminocystis sp. NIES-3709]BAQ65462.1 cobalt-precorrin-6x reductase [Geminocystis sp. NIES-3709]